MTSVSRFSKAWCIFEDVQTRLTPMLFRLGDPTLDFGPEIISEISEMHSMVEMECKLVRFCLNEVEKPIYSMEQQVIFTMQLGDMIRNLRKGFEKLQKIIIKYDAKYPLLLSIITNEGVIKRAEDRHTDEPTS